MELPPHLAPLIGLRLRAPDVELRLPAVAELAALAREASAGVVDPGGPPFVGDRTDRLGEPGSAEAFVTLNLDRRRAVRRGPCPRDPGGRRGRPPGIALHQHRVVAAPHP